MRHELPLPFTPQAPRVARQEIDGWLAAAGEESAERVRVATSELVSNALRHGRLAELAEREPVRILVDVEEDEIRVEVLQQTAAEVVVVPPEQRGPQGGFGLAIVDGIADRWGVDRGPPGSVWFAVRRNASRSTSDG